MKAFIAEVGTIIENIKPKDRKFIAEAPSRIASLIRYIRQLEGK